MPKGYFVIIISILGKLRKSRLNKSYSKERVLNAEGFPWLGIMYLEWSLTDVSV